MLVVENSCDPTINGIYYHYYHWLNIIVNSIIYTTLGMHDTLPSLK